MDRKLGLFSSFFFPPFKKATLRLETCLKQISHWRPSKNKPTVSETPVIQARKVAKPMSHQ